MFAGVSGTNDPYLRVICDDRGVTVTATGPDQTFAFNHPGFQTVIGQRLAAGDLYQLTITRGQEIINTESVRLKAGEQREIRIPHIVTPRRTVDLKPKAGSFPSDVVRMEFSPDRSAVAVERFDGPILVFDATTGRERFTVSRPKGDCTGFAFTHDSRRLVYLMRPGGSDSELRMIDIQNGNEFDTRLKPKEGTFSNSHAVAFSPDGKRLAVSCAYNVASDGRFRSRVFRWQRRGRWHRVG